MTKRKKSLIVTFTRSSYGKCFLNGKNLLNGFVSYAPGKHETAFIPLNTPAQACYKYLREAGLPKMGEETVVMRVRLTKIRMKRGS